MCIRDRFILGRSDGNQPVLIQVPQIFSDGIAVILSAPVWKSKTGQDRIHQALQNGRSPGGRPVINLGQFLSRVCKFDDFLICRAVEAEQNIGERHEGEQGEQNNLSLIHISLMARAPI